MTLFVDFPTPQHIENLPDSYEAYGCTIRLYHKKIATPCTDCAALHPEITIPHPAGEECKALRDAYK